MKYLVLKDFYISLKVKKYFKEGDELEIDGNNNLVINKKKYNVPCLIHGAEKDGWIKKIEPDLNENKEL